MSPNNNFPLELEKLLAALLPLDKIGKPMVTKELQTEKLEALDKAIANETFYIVVNLLTREIDYINGVEKWLGYSNQEFTLNRYLNIIHPGQAVLHNIMSLSMYKTLCTGVFRLQFSKQRYITQIGLKHYNGEYISFKKTTSIFQYDNNNRLLAQLNEFTKIDAYEDQPLKPRITEIDGLQKEDFEKIISEETLKVFMDNKFFSEKEFAILKQYAISNTINSKELAKVLKVAPTTIDTFNKRILEKARETFTHPFNSARQVALYLKKEKIL
jgi:hypothetical protein